MGGKKRAQGITELQAVIASKQAEVDAVTQRMVNMQSVVWIYSFQRVYLNTICCLQEEIEHAYDSFKQQLSDRHDELHARNEALQATQEELRVEKNRVLVLHAELQKKNTRVVSLRKRGLSDMEECVRQIDKLGRVCVDMKKAVTRCKVEFTKEV